MKKVFFFISVLYFSFFLILTTLFVTYIINNNKRINDIDNNIKKTKPEGKQGPQGPQGPEGKQGPQGPEGKQGPQGPEGKQGPQGPEGKQGPQGPEGKQGPQGPEGKPSAGYLKIDNINSLDIPSDYKFSFKNNQKTTWSEWQKQLVPFFIKKFNKENNSLKLEDNYKNIIFLTDGGYPENLETNKKQIKVRFSILDDKNNSISNLTSLITINVNI